MKPASDCVRFRPAIRVNFAPRYVCYIYLFGSGSAGLGLCRFAGEKILTEVKQFLFEEACRLEQTNILLFRTEQFLKEQKILKPSEDTIKRLIVSQREEAKRFIFNKISGSLTDEMLEKLEALLETKDNRQSTFQALKLAPVRPSPPAMLKLTGKLEEILATGVLDIDLSWLNNNFQRALTHYAKRCTATRLRRLEPAHRHAVLVCFLWQTYCDTVDFMVDMYDKLINKIYNHAQNDIDDHNKSQRKKIRESLGTFKRLAELVLDDTVEDSMLRSELFRHVEKEALVSQMEELDIWLNGKHSHVFNLVKERFSYIRQFSPSLLKHIQLLSENGARSSLTEAMDILREMNEENKRKLPEGVPLDFIPKKVMPLISIDGKVDKPAWECALMTAIRDEIKSGNVSVKMSKRFGRFDDFFIPQEKWHQMRQAFFERAGLPNDPS